MGKKNFQVSKKLNNKDFLSKSLINKVQKKKKHHKDLKNQEQQCSIFKIIPDQQCQQNEFVQEQNQQQLKDSYQNQDVQFKNKFVNEEQKSYDEEMLKQIEEQDKSQQSNNEQTMDLSVVNMLIQETLQILMNINKLGRNLPRKYHIVKLKKLIHQYYGYNFELIEHFLSFFNPNQMVQFMEANQNHRPLCIRTNTLKTRRKELAQNLIQRGVNLDPLADWSNVGIKIYQTKVPIGATPEYLVGHYMLQSPSSFLPVLALDPQPHQKILDLAAAPGGKTTYIAQLMKNTGCIFANDLKKDRLRALHFNILRMGITNTVVTCRDGRKYYEIFPNSFDKVLLDAPCTGLGIIAKDHSIKTNRLLLDIYKNSHLQKQLLLAAIDCARINGMIVYSTCSVSPMQNQDVVNYAIKKRFIHVVDSNVEIGEQGFTKFMEKRYHVDLKKSRRIYPHVHNMDGFYFVKIMKTANGQKESKLNEE